MKSKMSHSKGIRNEGFEGDSEITSSSVKKKDGNILELNVKSAEAAANDNYDPYAHRDVEHPTTNSDTFFHLLKGSLGTGILAMPNAFADSGYVIGVIGTIVIGLLCTYCIHLLVRAEYELCKRRKVPSMTYTGVAKNALLEGPRLLRPLANYSTFIINTFLLVYQLGTCCVYVVFVSSNIKGIVDMYVEEEVDVRLIMCIILLPLIFLNWIRNLKFLAPFSTFANFVTMMSFALILYYIFEKPFEVADKQAVGEVKNFPLFFGTVLFALEAIGVILPLENEMKKPKAFKSKFGVLNRSMVIIVVLYVAMGLFGYLRYGNESLGTITLNLPKNDIKAQAVQGMLAFAIFISHGLACYVAIDIAWNELIAERLGEGRSVFWEYLMRTFLVFITFLLAVAIPNLELFISLFGALCLSALGLAFPAIIETCVHWHDRKGFSKARMLLINFIIVVAALVGLSTGTYTSIKEIYHEFFVDKTALP